MSDQDIDIDQPKIVFVIGCVGLGLNLLVMSFLHGKQSTYVGGSRNRANELLKNTNMITGIFTVTQIMITLTKKTSITKPPGQMTTEFLCFQTTTEST